MVSVKQRNSRKKPCFMLKYPQNADSAENAKIRNSLIKQRIFKHKDRPSKSPLKGDFLSSPFKGELEGVFFNLLTF